MATQMVGCVLAILGWIGVQMKEIQLLYLDNYILNA